MDGSYVFKFPFEIERIIMEEAAMSDRQTALTLAVVARRVQCW